MKPKGSRYAQKHNVPHKNEGAKTLKTKIAEDDAAIWDILYAPDNFMNRFDRLTYLQQINMIVTLNAIIKAQEKNPKSGFEADFAESAQHCLNMIHKMMNSSFDVGNYAPLADDEKRLIRMDCYGKINKRAPHQLSPLYKYFSKPENRRSARLSEYNFDLSPSWRVFNQFESFRSIMPKVKYYLYKQKINPDALKVMTVNDFCDVIYKAFKKDGSEEVACFAPPEKNVRATQVKTFMRHCGKRFEQQLLHRGLDPRLVLSFCNALRRFGHSDINSLSVTEITYTPRVIKDLKKAGFDVSEIAVGDVIPQSFVNELIDMHRENLILARDNKGVFLSKDGLPRLELHHKHAVQFSSSNGYLARANYPNNLLLVESQIHAKYYHLFDQVVKSDQMNNMYSRLNINEPTMASLIGFSPDEATYFDFEQTTAFKKREETDKKCVVNYLKVMEERAENEMTIVDEYQIFYSEISLQRSARSIKEIMEKNHHKENMQRFQKWYAEQHRKGRQ